MSLNFFKDRTTKTDATLHFSSVLDDLKKISTSSTPLDIDQFLKNADVQLEQDQSLYKEAVQEEELPTRLEVNKQYSVHNTRMLANTLLDLSKTLPEAKQKIAECKEEVKICLEKNTQIMKDMESIQ
ncbi:hypothetical protein A0J61_00618 [Choanephora cucurbitarum]|uniref:Uncharacterized protein n=1 Tax=Choanephora cucurbitarum TaxID=101091 RepID=A0A1C7NQG1_9FUNG|nr:hypothetical protein A0J61_00618 [Choanephora cucurbitarum]